MPYRYVKLGALIAGAALCLGMTAAELAAQSRTLTRQYDPIVVDAGEVSVALVGVPIAELTAYRYSAAQDAFVAIPFQIDEKTLDGKYFVAKDGLIDGYDEISFMPGDTGDRAGTDKWLNDTGAQQYTRFELEVSDPLNPSQKGWIYLFRKLANPPAPPQPYVTHSPGPASAGADTVKGVSYVASHALNGWPNYAVLVKDNGESSANLMDRQKTRVKGLALGLLPYEVNEDNGLQFVSVTYGGGPVRGLRQLEIGLAISLGGTPTVLDTVAFVTEYFAYSNTLGAKNAKITPDLADLAGVSLIRQSMDLNANVLSLGMKFYNENNAAGLPIDGVADTPNTAIEANKRNWMLASGQAGGILVLVTVPEIGNSRTLYYRDNAATGTSDGTAETGDGKSYGDFGIQINGNKIQGQFSFDLTTYYLDPSLFADPVAASRNFLALQDSTVHVLGTEQSFATAVASPAPQPDIFGLDEAYPNPFTPGREKVRLAFNLGAEISSAQLQIYNLMGQEVARFAAPAHIRRAAGRQELVWDGRDRAGREVPAGVYFYRLQAGNQVAVKKFVLVR